jgi:hypothetical protein
MKKGMQNSKGLRTLFISSIIIENSQPLVQSKEKTQNKQAAVTNVSTNLTRSTQRESSNNRNECKTETKLTT